MHRLVCNRISVICRHKVYGENIGAVLYENKGGGVKNPTQQSYLQGTGKTEEEIEGDEEG